MASIKFEIVSYEVSLGHNILTAYINTCNALIQCKGKNGEELDIICLGSLPLPANIVKNMAPAIGTIYASNESYVGYIDALRNEKCYATLDDTTLANCRINFTGLAGWGHFDPIAR